MARKTVMGRTPVKKAEQLSTRPGKQVEMSSKPREENPQYRPAGKLEGKVALITGGDSGIGRAVAIHFAKEGADVAIAYLNEDRDAAAAKRLIEKEGRQAIAMAGDIGDKDHAQVLIDAVIKKIGKLDILINNAGEQHPQAKADELNTEQFERTFRTNIFGIFYLTKAALPHLKKRKGSTIINTASVTAYKGHAGLLDYSSTKGAVVSYTRTLAQMLAPDIRVNAVAPGPVWTPLIPSTFSKKQVKEFGKDTLVGRPAQPEELAPAYVFLASADSSYITGQTIHVNGGTIVNG